MDMNIIRKQYEEYMRCKDSPSGTDIPKEAIKNQRGAISHEIQKRAASSRL